MGFVQKTPSSFMAGASPPFSFTHMGGDILLNPVFLRFFTGFLHLILLMIVSFWWVYKKFTSGDSERQKPNAVGSSLLYYRPTLFSCLALSLFNLVLCILNHFHWYASGWSDEKIVTLADLGVKSLVFFSLFLLFRTHFLRTERKYPLVLRLWWGVNLSLSCYCLAIDFLYYKRYLVLSTLFWVSDVVSVVMSLYFCVIGFLGKKKDEGSTLQEPLLNGSLDNANETKKPSKGEETVTPYSNAGIFSLFTFSWIGPLVAAGYKKTLDLEDVPQLASFDTVKGAFPIFNSRLDFHGGGSGKVTTMMLAKGLLFTTRKEIALSAVYVLVYTFASYVGPYLIDNLVQFLNGQRSSKAEGYVLVSAFFIAKVFESVSQRHWFFKVQQAGFRARAALVAKVYNKGLTLSCQSRQGSTTGEIINIMSVDAERIGDFG